MFDAYFADESGNIVSAHLPLSEEPAHPSSPSEGPREEQRLQQEWPARFSNVSQSTQPAAQPHKPDLKPAPTSHKTGLLTRALFRLNRHQSASTATTESAFFQSNPLASPQVESPQTGETDRTESPAGRFREPQNPEFDSQRNNRGQVNDRMQKAPSSFPQQPASPTGWAQSPPQTGSPPVERRAFPRRDSQCTVSVCCNPQNAPVNPLQRDWLLHSTRLKGRLVDISMNGVAFSLAEALEPGDHLWLRIAHRQFDRSIDVPGEVVRTIEEPDGRWKTVCKFHKKLTFEDIHTLGKHLFQADHV